MRKQLAEIKHRHKETKKTRNNSAILKQINPQTHQNNSLKNYTDVPKQEIIDKTNSRYIGLTILMLPERLSCQITGCKKNKENKTRKKQVKSNLLTNQPNKKNTPKTSLPPQKKKEKRKNTPQKQTRRKFR